MIQPTEVCPKSASLALVSSVAVGRRPYRRPACGAACLGHFEHRRHEYEGTVF